MTMADKKNAALKTETKEIDLNTYIELVARCARERLDYPISNGSPFMLGF
jgi:hypothetical protein